MMKHMFFPLLGGLVLAATLLTGAAEQAVAGCEKGDCINGYSVYTWPDGSRYEGEFKNNTFHGKGKYTWANGKWYEGDFRNDKRNGRGVYAWPDGRKYTGEFVNGRRQGQGKFSWPDGSAYEGGWVDGKKEGIGTFNWPNGSAYVGQWKDGVKSGYGIYAYPDGKKDAGIWKNDELITEMAPAEVESALEAVRPPPEAATTEAAEAPAPPPPPATSTPGPVVAATPPPVAPKPVIDTDEEETATARIEEKTPTEASATASVSQPTAPIAAAADIAVHWAPLVDGYRLVPSVSAPLYSRGAHERLGEFTLAISEGEDNTAVVTLSVQNDSACDMMFDGYLRRSDTYYRVVTWHDQEAVSPGKTKTHKTDIHIDGSLNSGDFAFKSQGALGNCPVGR